ncbi:MAG: glycosyltransferase family 4 protein [Paludibacteraceae bacterium]|nr:glycosyltransferase family 4 protein [Paludibacteraceae bacterium]
MKMKKKHILLMGNTSWSMYNFRGGLIKRLCEQGYHVTVVAPQDGIFEKKIVETGAHFKNINISAKGTNPLTDSMLVLRLVKLLKELKPDFAFFYTIKPNIYGGLAAHLCNIPFIAVTTGLGYTFINNNIISKIARFLYKQSFKHANQVWFLNSDDCNDFLKYKLLPTDKCYVLNGEGVDTEKFALAPLPKQPSFILIARLLWDKGIGEYADAARIVKKDFPDVKFKLLGFLNVQNPSAITKEQVDKWVNEGIIEYLGETKDVIPYIKDSTCIVLPSYREGIPMTLLEGASMGRIIITADTVGCRNIVDDKVTGLLCKPKDATDLAAQIKKVINLTYSESTKMGLSARNKVVSEFEQNIIINKYLLTLDSVLL